MLFIVVVEGAVGKGMRTTNISGRKGVQRLVSEEGGCLNVTYLQTRAGGGNGIGSN